MSDYQDFPPVKNFTRVLKSCPRSAFLYVQLWKKCNAELRLKVRKIDVRKEFLISPTLFMNLLMPLISLHLVSAVEGDDKIQLTLSGAHLSE